MTFDLIAPAIGNLYKGSAHVRTSNFDGRKVLYAALKYMPRAATEEPVTGKAGSDYDGIEEWVVNDMPRRMREVQDFNTQLNALGLTTVYDMGYLDGPYEPLERLLKNNDLTVRVYYPLQYYIRTPKEVPRVLDMIRSEKPLSRNHWLGLLGMGEHVYGPIHDSAFLPKQVFAEEHYDQFRILATAAARYGWQSVLVMVFIMTGVGALLWSFPEPILRVFLPEDASRNELLKDGVVAIAHTEGGGRCLHRSESRKRSRSASLLWEE